MRLLYTSYTTQSSGTINQSRISTEAGHLATVVWQWAFQILKLVALLLESWFQYLLNQNDTLVVE